MSITAEFINTRMEVLAAKHGKPMAELAIAVAFMSSLIAIQSRADMAATAASLEQMNELFELIDCGLAAATLRTSAELLRAAQR